MLGIARERVVESDSLKANHSLKEGAFMRKRTDSNPPEFRPDSRLIKTAIEGRRCKRPNALKHGLFSGAVLIPGEDSGEYKQLLAKLMDRYNPAGPVLRDEVIELANWMWKRQRLRNFTQSQLVAAMFNPRTPSFNEAWGLAAFAHHLGTEPETCFEQHAKTYLRADKIKYLNEKFPRSNYQLTSDWAEAVAKEISSVLIPNLSALDPPEAGQEAEEMMEALRQWKNDRQVAGTIIQAADLLEYEIKETSRLNAIIHKQTAHCAALKAWEEAEEARNKK